MTGERHIKQAIIASLCDHPDKEKYAARAFAGDGLDALLQAQKNTTLTKADFFTPDDEGRYIINTPGFWTQYDKILAVLARNGERLGFDDFTVPLLQKDGTDLDVCLLDNAVKQGGLAKIFGTETWTGHFDEMENLWYRVPVQARRALFNNDGQPSLMLKRTLLAAEGRTVPEDGLEKAGITPHDVRQAFLVRGGYDDLKRRLDAAGDHIRKAYLLLPDNSGNTVFAERKDPGAWASFKDIVKDLKAHGERFEIEDFTRGIGFTPNILRRAAEKKQLSEVFNPDVWEGRLTDMMALWSQVLPGWQSSFPAREFDAAFAVAEERTYGHRLDAAQATKESLLAPVNADAVAAGVEKPVLPLGMKPVLEKLPAVRQALAAQGEKLTLADLRRTSGEMQNTCLMAAVKAGAFGEIVDIARKSGEKITVADFLSRDAHNKKMLDILAGRNELARVFTAEIWVGRVAEMKELWTHVNSDDRRQVDMAQVEVDVKQETLRLQSREKFRLKKPGAPE